MRIGIDLACWANRRGYGRYARELVRAMVRATPEDRFACYLDPESAAQFELAGPNVEVVPVPQSSPPAEAARADGYRSPRDLLRFTRAVWRDRPDVFFFPSVYTYFPLPPRQRAAVAVHDAIAERFPALTLPSRRARLFWRWKVRLALRQSRLVITVSDFSAEEIVRVLGIPRHRIRVTGEAAAASYRPSESPEQIRAAAARYGIPPDVSWFIYVGGFNPHKHVDVLARAHATLARAATGGIPHLVLVGSTTDVFHSNLGEIRDVTATAATLVHWTGYVPDEDLRHLMSGALALVLPSECEGFGLPAIEAAACGTPVIATAASPLPDLLRGGGVFVPPGDEAALRSAMERLACSPAERAALGARARERAGHLSWDVSARAALAALREAAA